LDRHGEDLARGAGTLFLASAGTQVGPGHFGLLPDDGVEKFSCHYEGDLEKRGRSFLEIRPLLWTADGWPVAGENVREGICQIRSQRTGTILQAPSNANNGTPVQTARYLILDNQKWTMTPVGGGLYKITGVASGNVLEAAGAATVLAPFAGADNQLWKLDQLSDGSYRIASKLNQLALTATIKISPGNGVALQPFSGDEAQRWIVTAP